MAVDFCDYFWGEEHNGWNVLYQNMRLGQTATKELTDFFKERWSIDETYAKSLNKLAQRVGGGAGGGSLLSSLDRWGSFAPVFAVLRVASEQLASVHLSVVAKLQEMVRELNRYQDQTHRKHKQVKDEESHTEDLVKTIQATSGLALKAKETYSQRCQDLERVRREGASPKDVEKAEVKLRKSYDEYKNLLEKYNNIREDFERCMTVSCKRFQDVEDCHLSRLLHSVREFVRVLGSSSAAVAQIQRDLQAQLGQHSVLSLLDTYALNKHTGLEKPMVMVFEDCGSLGSGISEQQSPDLGSTTAHSASFLHQAELHSSKSSAEDMAGGGGGGGVLTGGRENRLGMKSETRTSKSGEGEVSASTSGRDDVGASTSDRNVESASTSGRDEPSASTSVRVEESSVGASGRCHASGRVEVSVCASDGVSDGDGGARGNSAVSVSPPTQDTATEGRATRRGWRISRPTDRDAAGGALSLFTRKNKTRADVMPNRVEAVGVDSSNSLHTSDAHYVSPDQPQSVPVCITKRSQSPLESYVFPSRLVETASGAPSSSNSCTDTSPTSVVTTTDARGGNTAPSTSHRTRLGSLASAFGGAKFGKSKDKESKHRKDKDKENRYNSTAKVAEATTDDRSCRGAIEVLSERLPLANTHINISNFSHKDEETDCSISASKDTINTKRHKNSYPTFRVKRKRAKDKVKEKNEKINDKSEVKPSQGCIHDDSSPYKAITAQNASKTESRPDKPSGSKLSSIPKNFREWRQNLSSPLHLPSKSDSSARNVVASFKQAAKWADGVSSQYQLTPVQDTIQVQDDKELSAVSDTNPHVISDTSIPTSTDGNMPYNSSDVSPHSFTDTNHPSITGNSPRIVCSSSPRSDDLCWSGGSTFPVRSGTDGRCKDHDITSYDWRSATNRPSVTRTSTPTLTETSLNDDAVSRYELQSLRRVTIHNEPSVKTAVRHVIAVPHCSGSLQTSYSLEHLDDNSMTHPHNLSVNSTSAHITVNTSFHSSYLDLYVSASGHLSALSQTNRNSSSRSAGEKRGSLESLSTSPPLKAQDAPSGRIIGREACSNISVTVLANEQSVFVSVPECNNVVSAKKVSSLSLDGVQSCYHIPMDKRAPSPYLDCCLAKPCCARPLSMCGSPAALTAAADGQRADDTHTSPSKAASCDELLLLYHLHDYLSSPFQRPRYHSLPAPIRSSRSARHPLRSLRGRKQDTPPGYAIPIVSAAEHGNVTRLEVSDAPCTPHRSSVLSCNSSTCQKEDADAVTYPVIVSIEDANHRDDCGSAADSDECYFDAFTEQDCETNSSWSLRPQPQRPRQLLTVLEEDCSVATAAIISTEGLDLTNLPAPHLAPATNDPWSSLTCTTQSIVVNCTDGDAITASSENGGITIQENTVDTTAQPTEDSVMTTQENSGDMTSQTTEDVGEQPQSSVLTTPSDRSKDNSNDTPTATAVPSVSRALSPTRNSPFFWLRQNDSKTSAEADTPTQPHSVTSTKTTATVDGDHEPLSRSLLARSSKWFLRSRRDRKKEKKNKKKKDGADSTSNKEDRSDNECSEDPPRTAELMSVCSLGEEGGDHTTNCVDAAPALLLGDSSTAGEASGNAVVSSGQNSCGGTTLVDEEGYSIRPQQEQSGPSSSDSESEDDFERPIHVSIKPLSNGSAPAAASVDQLRATIQNMSLSSVGRRGATFDPPLRRSSSSTNTNKSSSADLLGLNLNFGSTAWEGGSPRTGPPSACSPSTGTSRYHELPDVMGQYMNSGEGTATPPPTLPPRGNTPTPTSTIPRPHSRRAIESRGRSSSPALPPSQMSRAESASSLEWRGAPIVGGSRGPSPLTLGYSDTIPLAIAFQELCHVYFRGSAEDRCQVKVTGEVMVSFPAGIVSVLTSRPPHATPLSFTLTNTTACEQVLPNTHLLERCSVDAHSYAFLMPALTALLRKQAEQNPTASYFNVDIIKYQVSSLRGASCAPLQLVSYWKCEEGCTELRVDYRYNAAALPPPTAPALGTTPSSRPPLLNVTLSAVVDGLVTAMHSKPQGQWHKEQQKAVWRLQELSSTPAVSGSLRAKFEVSAGPSTPSTVAAMFSCEAATVTGMDFQLTGPGYRLSLVKKRFVSGKYICDGDAVLRLRYGGSSPS